MRGRVYVYVVTACHNYINLLRRIGHGENDFEKKEDTSDYRYSV
jgi:hypothetical protein